MAKKARMFLCGKAAVVLVAAVLLLMVCGPALAQQGMTIPSSHPRLWWTPARLTQAQTWYASHPFTPEASDALGNALRYSITGETSYAQTAINLLMAFTISQSELDGTASDNCRWNDWVPLVYDWCYNQMTPTQRQTFRDRYDNYVNIIRQKSWGGVGMEANNYYQGYLRNELNWAITVYYDSSMADTFLNWACDTRWENSFLPYCASGAGKGGIPAEGAQYGRYMLQYPTSCLTSAGLLGRNMYRETNFYKEALFYYLYATSTGPVYTKGGASQYYQLHSFNDNEVSAFPPAANADYGDFLTAVGREWSSVPVGAYARYCMSTFGVTAHNWVACVDTGGSSTNPSGLPLDYYGPGYCNLYTKTSWNASATQALVQIGKLDNGGGHVELHSQGYRFPGHPGHR